MKITFNKILSHIGILLMTTILISSCKKDLGNYDYHDVNTVSIKYLGNNFVVSQGEDLIITPVISADLDSAILKDTARFRYEWTAQTDGKTDLYVLSNQRDLNITITLPTAFYKIFFKIFDKTNGMIYTAPLDDPETAVKENGSILQVTSNWKDRAGWLAWCDINGKASLEMISFVAKVPAGSGFDTVHIKDILSTTSPGLTNLINPVEITATKRASLDEIFFLTKGNSYMITGSTFVVAQSTNLTYRAFFLPKGGVLDPVTYKSVGDGKYLLHANGNMYYRIQSGVNNIAAFADYPINRYRNGTTFTEPFAISKYIGAFHIPSPTTGSLWVTLFDETNKRFVRYATGNSITNYCEPITGNNNSIFSFSSGIDKLLYMETTKSDAWATYAVIKATDGSIHYYTFQLNNATSGNGNQLFDHNISTAPGIANAELYAVDPQTGDLLYSVGDKLYHIRRDGATTFTPTEVSLNLGANEKITTLQFGKTLRDNSTQAASATQKSNFINIFNTLVLCTTNNSLPANECGTMYNYKVSGTTLTQQAVWKGFGKIVSVTHKEPPTVSSVTQWNY